MPVNMSSTKKMPFSLTERGPFCPLQGSPLDQEPFAPIIRCEEQHTGNTSRGPGPAVEETWTEPEPSTGMLREIPADLSSQDQLLLDMQNIYIKLTKVEAKCFDKDKEHLNRAPDGTLARKLLDTEEWHSLIVLHKQLLNHHYDFFLASQLYRTRNWLIRLVNRYSMPARMWRHGIYDFLEVLRHRLPDSLEHLVTFIHIAYSVMVLLYQDVQAFEHTWTECLGDLGRYRMYIEDGDSSGKKMWMEIAHYWYAKGSKKSPNIGRLYHHLAILAPPSTLEQLSLYTRSLTCINPFEATHKNIMTLFNPILNLWKTGCDRPMSLEELSIKVHGVLFSRVHQRIVEALDDFLSQLKDQHLVDKFIERSGSRFGQNGVFLAVSNISALFEFGAQTARGIHQSTLRWAFRDIYVSADKQDINEESPDRGPLHLTEEEIECSKTIISHASNFTFTMFEVVLAGKSWEVDLVLPIVHVMLVFIWSICGMPEVMGLFQKYIPWTALCSYLNHLRADENGWRQIFNCAFPSAKGTNGQPLPEDYIIRG